MNLVSFMICDHFTRKSTQQEKGGVSAQNSIIQTEHSPKSVARHLISAFSTNQLDLPSDMAEDKLGAWLEPTFYAELEPR